MGVCGAGPATAIGVNRRFDVPLVGDLRGVVPQLVEALKDSPRKPAPALQVLVEKDAKELADMAESAPSGRSPIHPARYVVEATKAFNELEDGILVRDGGATVIFRSSGPIRSPSRATSSGTRTSATSAPACRTRLGASVAEGGKRPVMLLTSDSAFLFHIAELETAARQNLPLVCVVGVDHQWGLEVGVNKRHLYPAVAPARRALEQGRPDGQGRRGLRLPR